MLEEGALRRGEQVVVAPAGSRRPLPRAFYERDTAAVARDLLGAILECETTAGRASGRIVETEAYLGASDAASHAVVGLTPRTRDLFGRPGTAYVYFTYGVHWCFNVVTDAPGQGRAVLIRALEPLEGLELMGRRRHRPGGVRLLRDLTNGPGKLCAALGITGRLSGLALHRSPLSVRHGSAVPDREVLASPRVGITRAAEPLRRFFLRGNGFVSRTPTHFPVVPYSPSLVLR